LAGEREQKNGLWCDRFDGVVDTITNRAFTFGSSGVPIEPKANVIAGEKF